MNKKKGAFICEWGPVFYLNEKESKEVKAIIQEIKAKLTK